MLLSEDFARCKECGNPWFRAETIYVVGKGSEYHIPVILRKQTQYKCTQCGSIGFQTDEEV